MNLPYDYSRCTASNCSVKETCARFTSPGRPEGWQTVSDFSSETRYCTMFIANSGATAGMTYEQIGEAQDKGLMASCPGCSEHVKTPLPEGWIWDCGERLYYAWCPKCQF
jgi:hypothetical protein